MAPHDEWRFRVVLAHAHSITGRKRAFPDMHGRDRASRTATDVRMRAGLVPMDKPACAAEIRIGPNDRYSVHPDAATSSIVRLRCGRRTLRRDGRRNARS
ncbi:hypothetical protein BDSB_27045 [Burkholderia dolosa PC543]|nr:hypothetical protein BDSB_27045 [Burkholderia dolosa PC543]